MLTDYIQAALKKAKYRILADDGSYYGEIPELRGVWANAATLEECRNELREVIEDWLLISISRHLPIPTIEGIELEDQGNSVASSDCFMKREELIKLLRNNGFSGPHSGTKHQIMIKGEVRVRVPNPHRHEIGKELLHLILKQAGINPTR